MKYALLVLLGVVASGLILLGTSNTRIGDVTEGEILYYEQTRQGSGNLVVLNVSTGKKRQVGQSGSRPDHFPSWSADGRKITFESYRQGGWHVWVADAAGENARRLSNLPDYNTRSYEFDPGFAPDNQTVIFSQGDDLWTVTLDDPTPQRVTPANNGVWETAPAFSPDGRHLVCVGNDDETDSWNLYLLNRDGTGMRALTEGQGRNFSPSWSPDGEHLLFYSDRGGSFELYEMTKDGEAVHPVFTQAQRAAAGFQQTAFVNPWDNNWGATEQYRASYAPDGQWIVFSRDIEGDRELFVARRDGSEVQRITHRAGLDGQPAWRPIK